MSRALLTILTFAFAGVVSVIAQHKDPATLPAREAHEGLLIAADPIDDSARAKQRFGKKNPHSGGLLALEIYFRNDTDRAIRVDLESIRLVLDAPDRESQRLKPMALVDVVNAIVYPTGLNPTAPRKPRPSPFPSRGTGRKEKDEKQVDEALRPLALEMDVLPPRATIRGLIFFDMDHQFELLRYAQLYVPGLRFVQDGKPLMFFEVDLSKAANR